MANPKMREPEEIGKAIDYYINERLDFYLQEIMKLCSQPSISATGKGTNECAKLVWDLLGSHGFESQYFKTDRNPMLIGKTPGKSNRTLLFYNHYDVQPPEPLELWDSPPFEPSIRDKKLYARGAKDDKGEIISRFAAVDAVRYALGYMPCNITILVEGEEENGSPNIEQFAKDHQKLLRADGAIWEEGFIEVGERPAMSLGARGILYIELAVKMMQSDAHSGYAHILPNAAWRLIHALSTIKNQDHEILIPGFYDKVKKPTAKDLSALNEWPDQASFLYPQFGINAFLNNYKNNESRHAVFNPTCNIAGITSGYQGAGSKTIIPSEAKVKIDFRLVPDQEPDEILDLLKSHLKKQGFNDVEITVLGKMLPFKTPIDDPLVKIAVDAGSEVYRKDSLLSPLWHCSSPMYAIGGLMNIPIINPGIGYWDNCVHAPNEHIRIKDFVNGTRQIARIISRY